jgi:hypothetical protein
LSCEQGEKRLNPWLHPSANHRLRPPNTDCVNQSQTVSTSHKMCSPIKDCVHQSKDVFINHILCPPIEINLKIRHQSCVYRQLHYECKMQPSPSCSVVSLDFGLTSLDSDCFCCRRLEEMNQRWNYLKAKSMAIR